MSAQAALTAARALLVKAHRYEAAFFTGRGVATAHARDFVEKRRRIARILEATIHDIDIALLEFE